MLVLARATNQTIEIGGDIRVTICRIDGGKVRLGVDAPPTTLILRGESTAPSPPAAGERLRLAA